MEGAGMGEEGVSAFGVHKEKERCANSLTFGRGRTLLLPRGDVSGLVSRGGVQQPESMLRMRLCKERRP